MRALLQRVAGASVTVEGETVGAIDSGLLVLLCAVEGDGEVEAAFLAQKIAKLRIFADADGKMNLALRDVGGAALAVSQFTLAADWRKGNRPSFIRAAAPQEGERLYDYFCDELKGQNIVVERGRFGAEMKVSLVNDGPVTIWLDTEDR